jgi:tRNA pseudouridine55 synthase
MDGLLVVDKPEGPTSHDVVVRVRRALGERRIGHTGTLDPAATGVLPLVLGRATRLAQYLSAADKRYEAVISLGRETDTYDADGQTVGALATGPLPDRAAIDRALDAFRGTFLQAPPRVSAKRIGGRRSYDAARSADPGEPPAPVRVTASAVDLVAVRGPLVQLNIECSSGFYVRSLAHDVGASLGTGAHLVSLRRTHAGDLSLRDAVSLDRLERDPGAALDALIPLRLMLPRCATVQLTAEGVRHARHGRDLGSSDFVAPPTPARAGGRSKDPDVFRLLDGEGELVGLARPSRAPGLLHPSVVLV